MSISAVIPFRATGGREHLLEVVTSHLSDFVDELIVCDDEGEVFSRASSINLGAKQADGDVLLICDADLVVPLDQLEAAAALAEDGMVVPFSHIVNLTREQTAAVVRGADVEAQRGRPTLAGDGGACLIDCITFDTVGGYDPRFRGWGHEASAFVAAVDTLVDPVRRTEGLAYHLDHPADRNRPSANEALGARYANARGDLVGMRLLAAGEDDE
jgi:glycosyltransferase involved in cell wall biosynthesis